MVPARPRLALRCGGTVYDGVPPAGAPTSREDWPGVAGGVDRPTAGGAVKCTAPGRSRGWLAGSTGAEPDMPVAAGETEADPTGGTDAEPTGDTAAGPLDGVDGLGGVDTSLTALANADHGESTAGVCGRRRCNGGTGVPGGTGVGVGVDARASAAGAEAGVADADAGVAVAGVAGLSSSPAR
ncbi:hypothetical protein GCM10027615_09570 [Plantactinospora veratri]